MNDMTDKTEIKEPEGKKEADGYGKHAGKKVPEEKPTLMQEAISLLKYLAVVLIFTFLIVTFVGVRTEVIGTSMSPTLQDGDNLIVEKLTYRFSDPERFDIIVFPYPENPGKYYIKRIIGMPGETVQIIDGCVYINGELLDENYGNATMNNPGAARDPIVLGPDEYFVLGDNRNNSEDSRYAAVGNIRRDEIVGRAWVRIWPFDSCGFLMHQ